MLTTGDLPFSQACENNKQPILGVLREIFVEPGLILEIGSGTGQHAVYFAEHLHWLRWQPSDHPHSLSQCRDRIAGAGLDNLLPPIALDVSQSPWPLDYLDGVFSANTAHIMGWQEVEAMFRGVARRLKPGARFCLYGPFNRHGEFTSESNRLFDRQLRQQAPQMGLRDLEDLTTLGRQVGLELEQDFAMPANNRLLVWHRA